MIIGIDITPIQYGTGVSNYTQNLVENLTKIDKTNTYKFFYSSLRNPLPQSIKKLKSKRIKIIHTKIPPTLLAFVWNRLHILPIELFIGKCHIFHTSDYTHPPTLFSKTLTTVHDLTPFLYPQWLSSNIVKNHKLKLNHAQKSSHHFICVSKNTRIDLLRLFPKIHKSKTSIIPEACEDKYKNFNKLNHISKQKIINTCKKKYGLANFILAQGTREPRKNLKRLIRAFIDYKTSSHDPTLVLAITGKYGWGQDIKNSQPDYIKILGYLPETDMVPIHAAATALAYTSLYEGFGLPILKAMAVGTPVITSNVSSTKEIAKGSALLVNPKSVKQISNSIQKIIQDANLRLKLKRRGIKTSKLYSWKITAKNTLAIYEKLR